MTTNEEAIPTAAGAESQQSIYDRWLDGEFMDGEAVRLLFEHEYSPIDATYKLADNGRKAVRAQMEEIVRRSGETYTVNDYEITYRDGTTTGKYPAGGVDYCVRTLLRIVEAMRAAPTYIDPLHPEHPIDAPPPLLRVVQEELVQELEATVMELADMREESTRAGAMYITPVAKRKKAMDGTTQQQTLND